MDENNRSLFALTRYICKYLPEILICLIALTLVLFAPIPIKDDGIQFEQLARSILNGKYEMTPGIPSMYREPGYPLFRAMIYVFDGSPSTVLLVQALLAVATCWLWRRTWEKIKPRSGWIGAWGTFIAYGYWLFARQHAYEILLGFLLALSFWAFHIFFFERRMGFAVLAGLALGVLTATRGVFIFLFIPVIVYSLHAFRSHWKDTGLRKLFLRGLGVFTIFSVFIPAIWMVRNAIHFNTFGIASRPGLVLLARGIKTEASWEQYFSSLAGTFTGDALLKAVYPQLHPIDRQHALILDQEREKAAELLNTPSTDMRVDEYLMNEAKQKIFHSPTSFAKYIAWTLIDDLRLVSLPSFTTPWGTMEPMFLQYDHLKLQHVIALLIANLLNLIWIIGGLFGCILGLRRDHGFFLLAIPYFYLLIIHAPLDNVVRFSATIQPIIGAFVILASAWATKKIFTKVFRAHEKADIARMS